ncbi:hypothetical protein D022_1656 [Vibrio parahaemolyticus 12310]|nr:hypothetical protein D022_1656 [Vibrio parahaemolyticus 12310]
MALYLFSLYKNERRDAMSTANKDYVSFQHVKKTYDGAN